MGDLKFNKSTDSEHEIKLDSELISAGWKATAARTGSRANLEVRTACVGNGAKIKITVKTEGGKTVAKIKDKIISNVYSSGVEIPNDLSIEDAVYFEFELSANGISGKSNSIPVITTPTIKKIGWSEKEAKRGDKVTLTCELEGVKDSVLAKLIIYEYDAGGTREKISEIKSEVKQGKVEAIWEYEYHEDTDDIPTQEELAEYGSSYNPPEYFFTVVVENAELGKGQESGLLLFKDWIEFKCLTAFGAPIVDRDYKIVLADGETLEGTTDKEGMVRVEGIPPGRVQISFADADDDSDN